MENFSLPFSIFKNIGTIPQGHEKPLKHALYNALALLLLFLCCAAVWALYIILEPFIKPLIWAVLVGSVLHPLKESLAKRFRSWFDKLDVNRTPLLIGLCVVPVNIVNDLSEFIGGKLLKNVKIIVALMLSVSILHVIYYYTPPICTSIVWKLGLLTYKSITFLIEYSSTTFIIVILIGYISVTALCWKPSLNNRFHYAAIVMWVLLSCYIANLGGSFQVSIFITLQLILLGGFISEVMYIHDEMSNAGKEITMFESTVWALQNKSIENTKNEETKIDESGDSNTKTDSEPVETEEKPSKETDPWKLELFDVKNDLKDLNDLKDNQQSNESINSEKLPEKVSLREVQKLKLQRSLSQPFSMSQLNKIQRKKNITSLKPQITACYNGLENQSMSSDVYLYTLAWACCAMLFWKNITLLPLLPLPILIYVLKHLGLYLGLWQWLGGQLNGFVECILDWCKQRYDAFVPVPARGLFRTTLKINRVIKDNVKDSIDTVSSIVVIFGLIIFVTCASVFFAIQIYAEAIKLVQTTGNVINSTVVHNPELRQLLPPSLEETLDSVLDNAYIYGREGISKVVRGMVHDADSVKTAKLEQQVLELWDRVYQAWMTADNATGPTVTSDAVQMSWEAFIGDIKKSPEMFNIKGLTEFVKQNIGTFISVLESVWSILKGNFSIVVGSFSALLSILLGGGTAVLNFILNMIVFLTTLFYLLSSSGDLYKPVDLITNFSPNNSRLNRFGEALAGAVNGVFKASLKMALFYGMWTWFIHNLFGVKIVYLPSALATVLGAIPFLGTYWACIPAVLDLWLAQACGFKAILLAVFQFLPTMIVDTAFYTEIKGGHPYLTGLAIAGGIFCLGFEGAIIGPLLLCGLYVVIDLSSSLFKETPSEEVDPLQKQISRFNMIDLLN